MHGLYFILTSVTYNSGIEPDDGFYTLDNIKDAIKEVTGYAPGIECNKDSGGHSQLYQVYLCVDTSGTDIIQCPVYPRSRCSQDIQFPKF